VPCRAHTSVAERGGGSLPIITAPPRSPSTPLFEGSGSGDSGNGRASHVRVMPPCIHRDYPARFLHQLGERLVVLIWKNRGQLPDDFGNA
jgi:hypothetical protein